MKKTSLNGWFPGVSAIIWAGLLLLGWGGGIPGVGAAESKAMAAQEEEEDVSPFKVTATLQTVEGKSRILLAFKVPAHHHLYQDEFAFRLQGKHLELSLPAPREIQDSFSNKKRQVFEGDFTGVAVLEKLPPQESVLEVKLRGCSEESCFFKETRQWTLRSANGGGDWAFHEQSENKPDAAQGPTPLGKSLKVTGKISGFVSSDRFLRFLGEESGAGGWADSMASEEFSVASLGSVLLILLGGMALNLTPCVLPMIPINLAILGAGAQRGNRKRGFILGGVYGSGMAMAYGGLGLAVVLAGAKFGTLNSSPWFNFGIAVVFAVLSLAMFDKISIDFTRFQRSGGGGKSSQAGAYGAAAVMGFVSALLAGACVAPVVISVLLVSTTLYQAGHYYGLLLPFVLGVGMALPWPFAAAGLSFLPKPGMWMSRVKGVFGVLILLFAGWYAWLGVSLMNGPAGQKTEQAHTEEGIQKLREAIADAKQTGKPVLVDFWASWCKNCSAMEHTTLRDPEVLKKLEEVQFVRIQAEHLGDNQLKPVLDQLGVMGLPTFVLLRP